MQKKVTIFHNVRRNRIFFTRAGRKTVKNTQEVVAIFPSNRYNGECDIPAEQDRRTIGVGGDLCFRAAQSEKETSHGMGAAAVLSNRKE